MLVAPVVMADSSDPVIDVVARDSATPPSARISFSISQAEPAVELGNISWAYHASGDPVSTLDMADLIRRSEKYRFSDDFQVLTILNLGLSDAGTFIFTAANTAGVGNATQELVVYGELNTACG